MRHEVFVKSKHSHIFLSNETERVQTGPNTLQTELATKNATALAISLSSSGAAEASSMVLVLRSLRSCLSRQFPQEICASLACQPIELLRNINGHFLQTKNEVYTKEEVLGMDLLHSRAPAVETSRADESPQSATPPQIGTRRTAAEFQTGTERTFMPCSRHAPRLSSSPTTRHLHRSRGQSILDRTDMLLGLT